MELAIPVLQQTLGLDVHRSDLAKIRKFRKTYNMGGIPRLEYHTYVFGVLKDLRPSPSYLAEHGQDAMGLADHPGWQPDVD